MASIWKRHPRYTLLLVIILLATCFILVPPGPAFKPVMFADEPDLHHRLARSEDLYEQALVARAALLRRFGPSPEDVET